MILLLLLLVLPRILRHSEGLYLNPREMAVIGIGRKILTVIATQGEFVEKAVRSSSRTKSAPSATTPTPPSS
jgi:hypothetical protein